MRMRTLVSDLSFDYNRKDPQRLDVVGKDTILYYWPYAMNNNVLCLIAYTLTIQMQAAKDIL